MIEKKSGGFLAGIILILIGVGILIGEPVFSFNLKTFHFLLGGLFLAAYFYKKAYGFLIPGCILLGVSLGGESTHWFGYNSLSSLYLGLSFIMIYVIDRIYRGRSHWWPLIPGGIIIFTSVHRFRRLLYNGWPAILIVLGLFIIFKTFKKEQHED